jgi:O-antigen ligase
LDVLTWPSRDSLSWVPIGVVGAVALGMGITLFPAPTLALTALFLFLPVLLTSAIARIAAVVLGGMLVLNVSEDLSAIKVGYLLICGIAVAGAAARLRALRDTRAYREARNILHMSFVFGLYVIVEIVLAISSGISPSGSLREGASYLLMACVPLLALDASQSARRRVLAQMFVVVTLAGTASYAVDWITRRDLTALPVTHLSLAGTLPAALVCYLSAGFLTKRHVAWAVGAGSVLALLLLTGNRTSFLILIGPLVIAISARVRQRPRIFSLLVLGPVVGIVALVGFLQFSDLLGIDSTVLSSRYRTLLSPSDLAADQSVQIRLAQTRAGWEAFREHPITGTGPGSEFVWTNPLSGLAATYQYIDSPIQFPAKFGMVGVTLLVILFGIYLSFLLRLNRIPGVYQSAALGFVASQAALVTFGSPVDEEGFLLGLLLLLALSLPSEAGAMGDEPVGKRPQIPVRRHLALRRVDD